MWLLAMLNNCRRKSKIIAILKSGYHDNLTDRPNSMVHCVPTITAYTWWNCQVSQTCKLLSTPPFKPIPRRFSGSESVCSAKLTHYSSKPQRPSDSSQSWRCILLSGDVHPNPNPTTKYPCPVCARYVTGRVVSYLCNRHHNHIHTHKYECSQEIHTTIPT